MGLDELLARVADDAAFRQLVRTDPRRALAGEHLDADELRRLDRAVRATEA
ncbi:hypothetical protein KSP35_22960 [Aquihabitans sp. G128]|uniref:hypothetical protein n=1 Tax=Aquihabitans sp. G128 TaxID=2849779 RepID=UPI001C21A329|nr:hypothetical protein [Aquihabitans sp. G128]QXC61135.1 hypothetical protein KSP35_22960 [Aquihabitans sp. G128]